MSYSVQLEIEHGKEQSRETENRARDWRWEMIIDLRTF